MALSRRATEAAKPDPTFAFWDILTNLWHPSDNPSGYVSLGLAENTLMHASLAAHIHRHMRLAANDDFTYGDGKKRLRAALARFLTRHLRPVSGSIDPAHVTVANGCSSVVEHSAWALANPGEAFLLGRPFYGTFVPDVTMRMGARLEFVDFGDQVDPFSVEAVERYEAKLLELRAQGTRVAAVLLANPHNPLGRCYSREALVAFMRLSSRHGAHLVSDEIYALSVFPNAVDQDTTSSTPFCSVLSIDAAAEGVDPSRVHCIWGVSKDFGANGLRLGALISQHNPELHAALLPVSLYSSTSSMTDRAVADALSDDPWVDAYIAENRRLLANSHAHVVRWARAHAIHYAPGVNAAFFLWVDLGAAYRTRTGRHVSDAEIDEVVNNALLRNRVFLASGVQFGSEKPGWFRIVFSQERSYLDMGLKRIVAALHDSGTMSSKL